MLIHISFAQNAQRDSSNIINYYALSTDKTIPVNDKAINAGKDLYAQYCTQCHAFCRQEIGPALASVTERRPLLWLLTFIRNPRHVINEGDPYANHLFQQYGSKLMPEFEFLEEDQILNILAYVKAESENEYDLSSGPPLNQEKVKPKYGKEYATEYYRNVSALALPMDNERITHGKELFHEHCQSCHEFCKKKLGPALASVTDRRPLPWLIDFISNPQSMLDKKDSYTQYLHGSYKLVMPSFSFLEEDEIIDVLAYIRNETAAPSNIAGASTNMTTGNASDSLKVPNSDTKEKEDIAVEPQWGSRIVYFVIGAATIAIFVYLFSKIWKKM